MLQCGIERVSQGLVGVAVRRMNRLFFCEMKDVCSIRQV